MGEITSLIATHDIDEAISMSDRVVMMTNGPLARVGEILEIDIARPRDREAIFEDPAFFEYREHLLSFLEQRSHLRGNTRTHRRKGELPEDEGAGKEAGVA